MNKRYVIFLLIVAGLLWLVSIWVYPQLPSSVAVHWDASGNPDGYGSSVMGAFLIPVITSVLLILFYFLPKIDPLRKNWEQFQSVYGLFISAFLLFMAFIHVVTLAINLGYDINLAQFILPALGVLFVVLGYLMPQMKRNWFLGIRTPWTISNEQVWNKTHQLGGKLFMLVGLLTVVGLIDAGIGFVVFMCGVVLAVIVPFVYSYLEFKKVEEHSDELKSTNN